MSIDIDVLPERREPALHWSHVWDGIAAVRARLDHDPSPERRRHLVAMIMFPTKSTHDSWLCESST